MNHLISEDGIYDGLIMSDVAAEMYQNEPKKFAQCCNGVGSTVGWVNRLVKWWLGDTIYGLSVRSMADIHDVEGTYPKQFPSRRQAEKWRNAGDQRLLINGEIIVIRQKNQSEKLKKKRLWWVKTYYKCLRWFGKTSFYTGKTIGGVEQ